MRAASCTRYDRSVPRPGAVLVLLLAALLHLFGRCHGPTASPDARADVLAQASATACGQLPVNRPGVTTAGQRAPAPERKPTARARTSRPSSRAGPVRARRSSPPFRRPLPRTSTSPPHRLRPRPPVSPAAETRAQLGVWRT
ncbi:hypothetical protein [Streptomyces murinus]|uniref:hypothetical protein n=1 Tax=Streptomyces murinus TaxID=33900 RepID=UPI0038241C67